MNAAAALMMLAALQTHGWSGDTVPLSVHEAAIARGERITVSCGTAAQLGIRAARRAGMQARLVGAVAEGPINGYDDGHVMMELRTRKGWTVYDLDGNRRAPAGVGVHELVSNPRWEVIASDPLYAESEATDYTRAVFANIDAWYARVLGTPTIWAGGVWHFRATGAQRAKAEALGYEFTGRLQWRRLTGQVK